MFLFANRYNCKFCIICRQPMKVFMRCKICTTDYHASCFSSYMHKCVLCKYCLENKCIKSMEEAKNKNMKLFKKNSTKASSIDIQILKNSKIEEIFLNYDSSQRKDPKLLKPNFLLNNEIREIHVEYKNKDSLMQITTFYTNIFTYTQFMDQYFVVNRCLVCLMGFHTSDFDRFLCIECDKCFHCEKPKLLNGEYIVKYVYGFEKELLMVKNICYCDKCHSDYYLKNELCPICNKSYTQEDMIECEWCLRWIHYECEPNKRLLDKIVKQKYSSIYKCVVCEVYEQYWIGEMRKVNKSMIPNDSLPIKNELSSGVYDLRGMDLIYPECCLCDRKFNDIESEIVKLIQIKSGNTTFFAHNICAVSMGKVRQDGVFIEKKNRNCKKCKKQKATLKCIYCVGKFYHFDCAFQDKNDLFRSNIILPVCEVHYKENSNLIPVETDKYNQSTFYLEQDSVVNYLQIENYCIGKKGVFENLIYGNTESFILRCDFNFFYLNNIKTTANNIQFRLKENGYQLKVEDIVKKALFYCEKNKEFLNDPHAVMYNPCMDKKYQTMNFTNSYISHAINKNRFVVGESKIHGKGVFATRFYFPDEVMINYTGECISQCQANLREKKYSDLDCYLFKTGDNVIDATFKGNISKFINQSCSPNCYSTEATWGNNTGILICSKTYISVGEELTYKYGFRGKKMICKCGSYNCKSGNI